jgi:hypothetical protein
MPGARIVEAMKELKERRDEGELVHEILAEIAEDFDVRVDVLRERAEASWGKPLETDRERHAAHFDFADSVADIKKRARQLARKVYEANLPGIKEFSFWEVNWKQAIDQALTNTNLDDPRLEQIARDEFFEESERMEKLIKLVRVQNA